MRMNIIDHDLLSIQEARILAENALEAQRTLATFPQEKLDEIVERMAEEISKQMCIRDSPHSMLLEIFTDKGAGTAILCEREAKYYNEED